MDVLHVQVIEDLVRVVSYLGGHVAQEKPPQRDGAEEQGDDAAQIQEL